MLAGGQARQRHREGERLILVRRAVADQYLADLQRARLAGVRKLRLGLRRRDRAGIPSLAGQREARRARLGHGIRHAGRQALRDGLLRVGQLKRRHALREGHVAVLPAIVAADTGIAQRHREAELPAVVRGRVADDALADLEVAGILPVHDLRGRRAVGGRRGRLRVGGIGGVAAFRQADPGLLDGVGDLHPVAVVVGEQLALVVRAIGGQRLPGRPPAGKLARQGGCREALVRHAVQLDGLAGGHAVRIQLEGRLRAGGRGIAAVVIQPGLVGADRGLGGVVFKDHPVRFLADSTEVVGGRHILTDGSVQSILILEVTVIVDPAGLVLQDLRRQHDLVVHQPGPDDDRDRRVHSRRDHLRILGRVLHDQESTGAADLIGSIPAQIDLRKYDRRGLAVLAAGHRARADLHVLVGRIPEGRLAYAGLFLVHGEGKGLARLHVPVIQDLVDLGRPLDIHGAWLIANADKAVGADAAGLCGGVVAGDDHGRDGRLGAVGVSAQGSFKIDIRQLRRGARFPGFDILPVVFRSVEHVLGDVGKRHANLHPPGGLMGFRTDMQIGIVARRVAVERRAVAHVEIRRGRGAAGIAAAGHVSAVAGDQHMAHVEPSVLRIVPDAVDVDAAAAVFAAVARVIGDLTGRDIRRAVGLDEDAAAAFGADVAVHLAAGHHQSRALAHAADVCADGDAAALAANRGIDAVYLVLLNDAAGQIHRRAAADVDAAAVGFLRRDRPIAGDPAAGHIEHGAAAADLDAAAVDAGVARDLAAVHVHRAAGVDAASLVGIAEFGAVVVADDRALVDVQRAGGLDHGLRRFDIILVAVQHHILERQGAGDVHHLPGKFRIAIQLDDGVVRQRAVPFLGAGHLHGVEHVHGIGAGQGLFEGLGDRVSDLRSRQDRLELRGDFRREDLFVRTVLAALATHEPGQLGEGVEGSRLTTVGTADDLAGGFILDLRGHGRAGDKQFALLLVAVQVEHLRRVALLSREQLVQLRRAGAFVLVGIDIDRLALGHVGDRRSSAIADGGAEVDRLRLVARQGVLGEAVGYLDQCHRPGVFEQVAVHQAQLTVYDHVRKRRAAGEGILAYAQLIFVGEHGGGDGGVVLEGFRLDGRHRVFLVIPSLAREFKGSAGISGRLVVLLAAINAGDHRAGDLVLLVAGQLIPEHIVVVGRARAVGGGEGAEAVHMEADLRQLVRGDS